MNLTEWQLRKIKMKKHYRVKIFVRLIDNGITTLRTSSYKKRRILLRVQVHKWQSAYLKVSYGDGIYNDGNYKNFAEFKYALDVFTARELMDEFGGKNA